MFHKLLRQLKSIAGNQNYVLPGATLLQALLVWVVGCSFFLMDYFVRVAPSIMTTGLMASFHMGGLALGMLSAIFFYPYVLLQPFIGAFIDNYGAARLMFVAALVCALSSILFALSPHLSLLFVARFLLGLSCSCSFIATLTLVKHWFKPSCFALMAGVTQACGMLGAVIGDIPFSRLYQKLGWRHTLLISAVLFCILTYFVRLIVRDRPPSEQAQVAPAQSGMRIFSSIIILFKQRQIWLNCLYNGALYGPLQAFAGLWGIPFLLRLEHVSSSQSALQVSLLFIGVACGSPIMGALSDRIGKRLPVMRVGAVLSLCLSLLIIYPNYWYSHGALVSSTLFAGIMSLLLFCFGFCVAAVIPSYSFAIDCSASQHHGVVLGLTNMFSLGIGALIMPAIGWVLDFLWQGQVSQQAHIFSLHSYQYALGLLPLSLLCATIISFLLRESFSLAK